MNVLSILRAWRARSPVEEQATADEVEEASSVLAYYEGQLGPGNTSQALDLAIEHEGVRAGRERRARGKKRWKAERS